MMRRGLAALAMLAVSAAASASPDGENALRGPRRSAPYFAAVSGTQSK